MGQFDFRVPRGATFDRTLTWWVTQGTTPRDITGYTFDLQIRDKPGGVLYIDKSTANGGISILDAANGKFRIVISKTETAALTFFKGVYDLKATDAGGAVSYPLEGGFQLVDPVTP